MTNYYGITKNGKLLVCGIGEEFFSYFLALPFYKGCTVSPIDKETAEQFIITYGRTADKVHVGK